MALTLKELREFHRDAHARFKEHRARLEKTKAKEDWLLMEEAWNDCLASFELIMDIPIT